MVDAIRLMIHDRCYRYSFFVFHLFAKTRVEVDEGPKFTTCSTNGGSKSIEMDVGANRRTNPKNKK
jgi:hypothetical protein